MSHKQEETNEFVEKILTSINKSMSNCQTLLVRQLDKEKDARTELAIRKSYDTLEVAIKNLNFYKSEMEPEYYYCDGCGAKIDL